MNANDSPQIISENASEKKHIGPYDQKRREIEAKAWDGRVVPAIVGCLIVCISFLLFSSLRDKPLATDQDQDSHRVLVILASSAHKAMEEAFESEKTEKMRQERGSLLLDEFQRRAHETDQAANAIYETNARQILDTVKTIDDKLAGPVLNERTLSPAAELKYSQNIQDNMFFGALLKDTRNHMKNAFGKRSFDEGALRTKVEMFGCSHVIAQRYPGRICIEGPKNAEIASLLTHWYAKVDQKEPVQDYCERFYGETHPDLFQRLKKASQFHIYSGQQTVCRSPFQTEDAVRK